MRAGDTHNNKSVIACVTSWRAARQVERVVDKGVLVVTDDTNARGGSREDDHSSTAFLSDLQA